MRPDPGSTPVAHTRRSEEQDGRKPQLCPSKDRASEVTGKDVTVGVTVAVTVGVTVGVESV